MIPKPRGEYCRLGGETRRIYKSWGWRGSESESKSEGEVQGECSEVKQERQRI